MKKALMAVLKLIVKAIYPLVKVKRRAVMRIKGFIAQFTKDKNGVTSEKGRRYRYNIKIAAASDNLAANKRTRYRPGKKVIWKDKRIIAGVCTLVVIITVVLALTIPGKGNNVYASDLVSGNTPKSGSLGDAAQIDTSNKPVSLYQYGSNGIPGALITGENENLPSAETPMPTPVPTPVPTTAPDNPDLVPGCHDPRIVEIQSKLMDLNFMDSDEPTDYYGWGTEYSLQLFQRKNNLQVDGLAGNETLLKLFSSDAMPYTVKLGDSGTDVETLQEQLIELKYLKSKATGDFGTATEAAVKSFQKINGLAADGDVGEQTRELMFSEEAKPAPAPKPPTPTKKPSPSSPIAVGDPDKASADALIAFAKTKLNCSYSGGAKGPNSFDCSGFVYYCLNQIGHRIGYMTSTGWAHSSLPKVANFSDMKPGDIICYSPHHVAIFIGGGQMIDASSSNGQVVIRSCDTPYWRSHFICARRVF